MNDMQRAVDLLNGALNDVHVPGINKRDCLMQAFTEVRLDERRAIAKWMRHEMLEAFGMADDWKANLFREVSVMIERGEHFK